MDYILIIDDSETIRSTIELLVNDLGFSIKKAKNGQEALEEIKKIQDNKENIKLCIADVNMPVMDGITFVAEFRKIDKFTPVIMLTSENSDSTVQAGKKAGASGWIVKPFKADQFIETIKRFIK